MSDKDVVPPEAVQLRWCPVCGRDDSWQKIGESRHWAYGEVCPGDLMTLTYVLRKET